MGMLTMLSFSAKNLIRPFVAGGRVRRLIQTSSSASMPIKAGDKLPVVDLFDGTPGDKVSTGDKLSSGKTVIFGVPGAFTPTCSNDHVPGFVNLVDSLKAKGVDNIVCVSVNDPFVMAAWGKSLDPQSKISFLADTCGAFTKELDLALDLSAVLGNVRCKRFALVAENGVVSGVNVEPDGTGLTCSKADEVLKLV